MFNDFLSDIEEKLQNVLTGGWLVNHAWGTNVVASSPNCQAICGKFSNIFPK
jgi:hypothetical protein